VAVELGEGDLPGELSRHVPSIADGLGDAGATGCAEVLARFTRS
jgi:hypothetical protein